MSCLTVSLYWVLVSFTPTTHLRQDIFQIATYGDVATTMNSRDLIQCSIWWEYHRPSPASPHSKESSAAKSLQSCPTLCNPIDGSPPGSPVPGILQARILEGVAISFSNACKWNVKVKSFSRVRLLATPLTTAHQAPPSMGFSRQEYWGAIAFSVG